MGGTAPLLPPGSVSTPLIFHWADPPGTVPSRTHLTRRPACASTRGLRRGPTELVEPWTEPPPSYDGQWPTPPSRRPEPRLGGVQDAEPPVGTSRWPLQAASGKHDGSRSARVSISRYEVYTSSGASPESRESSGLCPNAPIDRFEIPRGISPRREPDVRPLRTPVRARPVTAVRERPGRRPGPTCRTGTVDPAVGPIGSARRFDRPPLARRHSWIVVPINPLRRTGSAVPSWSRMRLRLVVDGRIRSAGFDAPARRAAGSVRREFTRPAPDKPEAAIRNRRPSRASDPHRPGVG